MKAGWEVKRLGDLYQIGSSKRVLQKQWMRSGVPFFRAREIVKLAKYGSVENELFISEEHFEELKQSRGIPTKGDLMVSAVGTLGACYVVQPNDRFYFKDASVLWFRPKAPIYASFVRYAFEWDGLRNQVIASYGATVGTFTISRANGTRIPLPPLEEQQRIVAVLDEAFEGLARARENAEANILNAGELTGGSLDAVFDRLSATTPSLELQDVCTERGITYGVIKLGEHDQDGVPCLRTSNVRPLRIDVDGIKIISPDLSSEYRRTILEGGEILVNVRGTLGGVAPVPERMAGWNISREVAMIPVDHARVDPHYASYFISTRKAQAWLTGVIKGAAYKGINLTDLRKLKLPLPGLKKQKEIVDEIIGLRKQCLAVEEICNAKLRDLDDLRQSLLQKAFAGELT